MKRAMVGLAITLVVAVSVWLIVSRAQLTAIWAGDASTQSGAAPADGSTAMHNIVAPGGGPSNPATVRASMEAAESAAEKAAKAARATTKQ